MVDIYSYTLQETINKKKELIYFHVHYQKHLKTKL